MELTVLVHGFYQTGKDMCFLSNEFRKSGIQNVVVNLSTVFSSIDDCAMSLHSQISELQKKYETINYVGHSMGGLIIRRYIQKYKQTNVGKCVFIATPHRGAKLAKIANYFPFCNILFRAINDLLPSSINNYLLDSNQIIIGTIIGEKNELFFGKLFLSKCSSDGRIEVESALSEDAKESIRLKYGHRVIHHTIETANLAKNFILNGTFENKGNEGFTQQAPWPLCGEERSGSE